MGIGDFFFGNDSQPGLLGTGQFHYDVTNPNRDMFQNTQSSGYYQDVANGTFQDAGRRQAPTSEAATLGPASTSADPMLGPAQTYGGASIDQTYANQARNYQMGLMGQLSDEAAGKGPSIAGAQMNAGLQNAMQQQMSAAGSLGAAGNPALAMRNLQFAGAAQQGQIAQQAGIARLQEQQAAQAQLAGLSSGVRAQDLGVAGQQASLQQQAGLFNAGAQNQFALTNAGFEQANNQFNAAAKNQYGLAQAGFQQQTNLANQNAALGMYGLNDAQQRAMLGAAMNENQSDFQAQQAYEMARLNQQDTQAQLNHQAYEDTRGKGIMELAGIAGGAAMLASDEAGKADIASGASDLSKFLQGYSAMSGAAGGNDNGMGALMGNIGKIGQQVQANSAIDAMQTSLADAQLDTMKTQLDAKASDMDKAIQAQNAAIAHPAPSAPSGGGGGLESMLGMASAIGGGGDAAGLLSDEEKKSDVEPGKISLSQFLSGVGSHSYRYKDPAAPGAAPGKHFGPMAQELEKSGPVGESMVMDTPFGKMVDTKRVAMANLSATADHERRLSRLEKRSA